MYPVDFLYEGNDESPNPDIRKILKKKEKRCFFISVESENAPGIVPSAFSYFPNKSL